MAQGWCRLCDHATHIRQRGLRPKSTMTKSELLALLANGENSGVEFKRDDIAHHDLGGGR